MLQYLNIKTRAADRGSKARPNLANLYALFVLIEDYLQKGFDRNSNYSEYEGATYSPLLERQRQLPFGERLQNHALNHRLNGEFRKYFPAEDTLPIIRDVELRRYWINEGLLKINVDGEWVNLADSVIGIIDAYVSVRKARFQSFMDDCKKILAMNGAEASFAIDFIKNLLKPNVDARIFEIVSYAILKQYYSRQNIFWGWSPEDLNEDHLMLFKTGRTNANDGGIDFVMRPLGRFFQVTETINSGKYFLDIDKVQKYPITFVVKTDKTAEVLREELRAHAIEKYRITRIVDRYIDCVEEIINVPMLVSNLDNIASQGKIESVVKEIVLQSKIEFNINTEDDEMTDGS